MQIRLYRVSIILAGVLLLSACGSNSSQKSPPSNDYSLDNEEVNIEKNSTEPIDKNSSIVAILHNKTIHGKVISDSRILEAKVFLDINKNSELDDGEPYTQSDIDGSYSLDINQSLIESNPIVTVIATGGKNRETKEPFDDMLMATEEYNSTINITPIGQLGKIEQ
jgi:hypothetical protein